MLLVAAPMRSIASGLYDISTWCACVTSDPETIVKVAHWGGVYRRGPSASLPSDPDANSADFEYEGWRYLIISSRNS